MLIVFEGIDGSGKTTISHIVSKSLDKAGYDTVIFSEPTDMKWGKKIRRIFNNGKRLQPYEEVELFNKDRRDDVEKRIKPALQDGKTVIMDRYYFSTAAYQGAAGLHWKRIVETNEKFAVIPDMVFFLAIEPEDALNRIEQARSSKTSPENKSDLKKISFEYRRMFAELRKNGKRYQIHDISALQPIDSIAEYIVNEIAAYASSKVFLNNSASNLL